MPKKWIIIATVAIVAVLVVVLVLTYEPPDISMSIDDVERASDGTVNLTLTYTTKDVNITGQDYRVRIVGRRTLETTEEKKQLVERPLPDIGPESSQSQSFSLEAKGFTDVTVEIWKGNNRVLLKTQRLPMT